jgi:UDP-N-acetyl-D-galactosamine dehydrogenase
VRGARVGVLGLTFKENVNDIRNSKVPSIVSELGEFGVQTFVHDPVADAAETRHEYGLDLCGFDDLRALDGLVLAVSHDAFLGLGVERLLAPLRDGGVLVDVKSGLDPQTVERHRRIRYWSL